MYSYSARNDTAVLAHFPPPPSPTPVLFQPPLPPATLRYCHIRQQQQQQQQSLFSCPKNIIKINKYQEEKLHDKKSTAT